MPFQFNSKCFTCIMTLTITYLEIWKQQAVILQYYKCLHLQKLLVVWHITSNTSKGIKHEHWKKSTYSLLNAEICLLQKCYCHCPTFFRGSFDKKKKNAQSNSTETDLQDWLRYKTVMAVSTISTKFIVPYTMLQEHFITDSKIYLITTQCWFLPVFFACVIKMIFKHIIKWNKKIYNGKL